MTSSAAVAQSLDRDLWRELLHWVVAIFYSEHAAQSFASAPIALSDLCDHFLLILLSTVLLVLPGP